MLREKNTQIKKVTAYKVDDQIFNTIEEANAYSAKKELRVLCTKELYYDYSGAAYNFIIENIKQVKNLVDLIAANEK